MTINNTKRKMCKEAKLEITFLVNFLEGLFPICTERKSLVLIDVFVQALPVKESFLVVNPHWTISKAA